MNEILKRLDALLYAWADATAHPTQPRINEAIRLREEFKALLKEKLKDEGGNSPC
jgi:hypothetical protein